MQPRRRLNIATIPATGVIDSSTALDAPVPVPVVASAKRAAPACPKRKSLPSMLPRAGSTPSAVNSGLPADSAQYNATSATAKIAPIVISSARPCRQSPTIRPNPKTRATGKTSWLQFCSMFDQTLGFSNGWAELALKNPPPLSPINLIASWLATGPSAANEGDSDCDRRRRIEEVVRRQARHLRQGAQRRLPAVGLPVRVGDEAD